MPEQALVAPWLSTRAAVVFYVAAALPLRAAASFVSTLGMKALFSLAVAEAAMGTALAALDVLSSVCGVVAPALGGLMLQRLGAEHYQLAAALGYATAPARPFQWSRGRGWGYT